MVLSASIAISTVVTLAITKLIEGVRNLLYMGRYSNRNSLNAAKFLPHAIIIDSIVAAKIHQRSGPLTIISPNTNRNITMAPKYTGPEVKGWSPHYSGACVWRKFL